jgi:hypothetical protein
MFQELVFSMKETKVQTRLQHFAVDRPERLVRNRLAVFVPVITHKHRLYPHTYPTVPRSYSSANYVNIKTCPCDRFDSSSGKVSTCRRSVHTVLPEGRVLLAYILERGLGACI